MQIVERATGIVAVHCEDGRGRTGTMIALYMMRKYGFRARQAIAWVRLMQPGSVTTRQQTYLQDLDQILLTFRVGGLGEMIPPAEPQVQWAQSTHMLCMLSGSPTILVTGISGQFAKVTAREQVNSLKLLIE